MSMLTLEEAISHALEVAEQEECFINYPHSDIVLGDLDIESRKHYVAEQKQLAEWLTELKEAKRLLKAAVEGMRWLNENTQDSDGSCAIRTEHGCSGCPLDINGDLFCKWKHEAEALALIGEEGDTNGRN